MNPFPGEYLFRCLLQSGLDVSILSTSAITDMQCKLLQCFTATMNVLAMLISNPCMSGEAEKALRGRGRVGRVDNEVKGCLRSFQELGEKSQKKKKHSSTARK